MVVVAQGNNWYIESFHVARATITNGNERATTHTLEKPGILLGGSATMDADVATSLTAGMSLILRSTDDSEIVIGENITALESLFQNDTGASISVGETVLILLRSHR